MTPVGSIGLFPGKLHNLLDYAEENNLHDAISWVDDGKAFVVRDAKKLEEILPKFFRVTKYKSFQRQLNMWNFERTPNQRGGGDKKKGQISHPYFIRGQKSLCKKMSRQNEPLHPSETEASNAALAGVISVSQLYNELDNERYDNTLTMGSSSSGDANAPTTTSSFSTSDVSVAVMGSSSLSSTTTTAAGSNGMVGSAHLPTIHLSEVSLYSPPNAKKQRSEAYNNNNAPVQQHAMERIPENSLLSACFGINGRSTTSDDSQMNVMLEQQEQQLQQLLQQQQQPSSNQQRSSGGSPLECGDVVEFEGRTFHYLDGNEAS